MPIAQLVCRCFGLESAQGHLRKLRAVWVSHRHADHHAGLPHLLHMRARLQQPEQGCAAVPVFGPFQLRKVLSACNKIQPLAFAWHDQYGLCPKQQGAGRGLDFFWEHADCLSVQAAAATVCKVR